MNTLGCHHNLHRLLFVLLVCGLGLLGLQALPVQGQGGEALRVDREVNPLTGEFGQVEFTVTLTLSGDSDICDMQIVSQPTDIILVLDRSGSMNDAAGGGMRSSKFEVMQEAAKGFINRVDLNRDRVGVVAFDGSANTVIAISSDARQIQQAIDQIGLGSSTKIDAGILVAEREFGLSGRNEATQVLVLLTDGRQSSAPVLRAAEAARNTGIRIITIGLGSDVDADLLREIASQPSDYYAAAQAGDLEQIYATIAEVVIRPVAASQIVVNHNFDPTTLEITPDSIDPPGNVSGGTITWVVPKMLDVPIPLSYRVQPRNPGQTEVGRGDQVTYQRCGDPSNSVPINFVQGLPLSFLAPPTPTLRPTLTPAPPLPPTPTPTTGQKIIQGSQSFFCDSAWWPWLLGFLVFIFLLWWLWRVWQELQKAPHEQRLCALIPWLLLPILILALNQLLGVVGACDAREAVYFWRIDERGANGIYTTDLRGLRPAQPLTALTDQGCIGCHTVNSNQHQIAAIKGGLGGPIVVYKLDGTPVQVPDQRAAYLSWSPDGSKLAFSDSQLNIQILDLVTGITTELEGANDPAVAELMPAWSPDGQTIAFVRGTTTINQATFAGPCDIYVVAATGGIAVPLPGASGDGFNYYPSFSPDGRWVAFTRHTNGQTTYAAPEAEIFLVPSTGGSPLRLAANDAPGKVSGTLSNSWPTWSRDGQTIAFNSKRDDSHYDIFVTTIDTNGNSGAAIPLRSAAQPGVFEHLPFWGEPPARDITAELIGLWPWLIPIFLVLLAYWLCRLRPRPKPPVEQASVPPPPGALPPLQFNPFWQVAPTLIIGTGGTGRMVLTQLKKSLRDGGGGQLPSGVKFVLLDTSELEQTNIFRDAQGKAVGVEFAGVSLEQNEVLLMGQNLSSLIERTRTTIEQALDGWFPYKEYRTLPVGQRNLGSGTGGRRPLARAGLIDKLVGDPTIPADEVPPNDATYLWDRLVEGCQAAYDTKGRIVRVIVVGSVAGGMSGTITDLAYLARQAAHMVVPKDGTIYIEGYFATPEVFRTVAANPDALNINAAATLRELQRFQLNQGLPFPFSYQTEVDPQRGYLKGNLSVPMFDYITLFGGSGEPERGTDKADEPWATVLASMADTIALRLDRAVNAGAQGDYRSGLHAQATTKQTNTQKAIVAGTGSYVVRVPIVDIQEIVEARWARKLFHVFLNGSVDSELPSFNPDEAGMETPVANYAKEFILGQHVAGEPPHGMSTVAYLTGTGKVRARDVIDLANDEEGRPYYDYLGYALGLILNGDQQGSFARRAPRLGYAQAFLTAVLTYFTEALNEARNQGAIAPAVEERSWFQRLNIWFGGGKANQNEWGQVVKRLQAWIEVTKQALTSLEAMRNILIGGDQRPNSNGSVSLYQELAQRQAKAEQRREQMDRIAVRRYLWRRPLSPDRDPAEPDNQVELVDEWYEQVEPRVAEHLQRFRWNIDRNGSLALRLVTFEKDAQKAIALDAASHSITAIADEIERLAKSVTQDLASNVALHELLLTMMPSKLADPTADLVRLMWRTALPHIRYAQTPNQTIDGEMQAVAGLPPQLQKGQAPHPLQVSFQNLGGPRTLIENTENPVPTNVIESTDSMAITLVREYSLMPLIGVPEYKSIWAYYQRNAGSANDTMVESPLLATVYAAERASLEYERRLERGLNQDFRALHPIIVMGLARPELAERYLAAFAAGWIVQRAGNPWLQCPDEEFSLALRGGELGMVDWRVVGLLRIAAGDPEDQSMFDSLNEQLDQANEQTRKAWQGFVQQFKPSGVATAPPAQPRFCLNQHLMKPNEKFCGRCGAVAVGEGLVCNGPDQHPMKPNEKFCGTCGFPARPNPTLPQPPVTEPIKPIDLSNEPVLVQDLMAVAALAAFKRAAPDEWEKLVMQRSRRS